MPIIPDPLRPLHDAISAWATNNNVPLVRGIISETGALPELTLYPDADADIPELLAALEGISPRLVALMTNWLDQEDYDSAVEQTEDVDDELTEEVRSCEQYIGHVSGIVMSAVGTSPPIVMSLTREAAWLDLIYGQQDLTEDEDAPLEDPRHEASRLEREKWTSAKRTEVARTAAQEERFPACKTEAARVYLLRQLLGDDTPTDEYMLKEISREARAIYDLEIKNAKRDDRERR